MANDKKKETLSKFWCVAYLYCTYAVVFLIIAVISVVYQSEIRSYDVVTAVDSGKWYQLYIGAFIIFAVLCITSVSHCCCYDENEKSQDQINKKLPCLRWVLVLFFFGIVAASIFAFSYVNKFNSLSRCPDNSTEIEIRRQNGDKEVDKCVTYTQYLISVFFVVSFVLLLVTFVSEACDRIPGKDELGKESPKKPAPKINPVKQNENKNSSSPKPKPAEKSNVPKQDKKMNTRAMLDPEISKDSRKKEGKHKKEKKKKNKDENKGAGFSTLNPLNTELQQNNVLLLTQNEKLKQEIELLNLKISHYQNQPSTGITTMYHVESEMDTRPPLTIPLPPTYRPLCNTQESTLPPVAPPPHSKSMDQNV